MKFCSIRRGGLLTQLSLTGSSWYQTPTTEAKWSMNIEVVIFSLVGAWRQWNVPRFQEYTFQVATGRPRRSRTGRRVLTSFKTSLPPPWWTLIECDQLGLWPWLRALISLFDSGHDPCGITLDKTSGASVMNFCDGISATLGWNCAPPPK